MKTPPPHLHDILILRQNGDTLNTSVLNKTFTIKTSFGNVTVKTEQIVWITMQRGVPDELITNSSNILKGRIQDKRVSVIIFTGDEVAFRLPEDVLAIQFLDHLYPFLRKKLPKAKSKT
jgi:hypothetical protein